MSRSPALFILMVVTVGAAYGGVRLYTWAHDSNVQYRSDIAAGKASLEKFYAASPTEQKEMLAGKEDGYIYGLGFTQDTRVMYQDANGNLWVRDNSRPGWVKRPGHMNGPYAPPRLDHH